MDVRVLLSSGEVDEWGDVAETIEEAGQLVILEAPEGDELDGRRKTATLSREIDQGPDLPPTEKTQSFYVMAIYAAGMWMRVEFDVA